MLFETFMKVFFGEQKFDEEKVLAEFKEEIEKAAQKIVDEYLDSLTPEITFEKTSEDATIPSYADEDAEGMDLYSPINVTIPSHGKVKFKLGIKAHIPNTHWLMFASRSGMAWNNSIEKGAGIIDVNFRKDLGLVLYNHSDEPYHILKGDKVAQAIPMRRNRLRIKKGVVDDTARGGLGSSGR